MTDQELVQIAFSMHQYSYVPYSKFPVGARPAVPGRDGVHRLQRGKRRLRLHPMRRAHRPFERPSARDTGRTGRPSPSPDGERTTAGPCGACRQMLYEFAPGLRVIAARGDGAFQTVPLDQLLPHGFGPKSLN